MSLVDSKYFSTYFSKYRQVLSIFSASLVFRGLSVIINLATGVLMTRGLLEANRGLFSLFLTSLLIFNVILNLGFNSSATYYAKKDPEKMQVYLSTNLILSVLSVIVIAVSISLLSFYFTFQSNELRCLFIICYVIFSFSLIYKSFLIGLDENLFILKVEFILRFFYLMFILYLEFFDSYTVLKICSFFTIEYLIFTFIAHYKIKIPVFPLKWDFQFLKESALFNSKTYIGGMLAILFLRSDQYFIKYFNGNFDVGVYSVCANVIENMGFVTSLVATMYIPKLLEYVDLELILEKSKKILLLILFASVLMSVCMYFLSPFVIQVFFKKMNLTATNSLRILLLGFISWSLFSFIYTVYFSLRIKKSILIIMGLCLLLNFILNYVYVPRYGIVASAWASSVCYTLLVLLSLFDLFYLKKKNYLKRIVSV